MEFRPLKHALLSTSKDSPTRITDENDDDKYSVLSPDEIRQYEAEFVEGMNTIIGFPYAGVTRRLLIHCKWDKRLLAEKFFSDSERLFREARVINPLKASENDTAIAGCKQCEICCFSYCSVAENACGHTFCTECWSKYLKGKINDEGVGKSIPCPAADCDIIVDDELVNELVDDIETKDRYRYLTQKCFVQHNENLRWCPAPGCSFAVKVDPVTSKPILCICKCGHEFCFNCLEEWHRPVPCEIFKRFNGHVGDMVFQPHLRSMPYGNRQFQVSKVDDKIKKCPNPKCSIPVQRAAGCDAMHCPHCSTNFCWTCMLRFRCTVTAHFHKCPGEPRSGEQSTFRGDDTIAPQRDAGERLEVDPLDRELNGLLDAIAGNDPYQQPVNVHNQLDDDNFHTRYTTEDANLKSVTTRLDQIKVKLQNGDNKSGDLGQLESALISLAQCRHTLKFTAILVMYLKEVDQSMLFKAHYHHLRGVTNELSKNISKVNKEDTHSLITDSIIPAQRICKLSRQVLLEYVDEGHENGWWDFEDHPKMYEDLE